MRVKVIGKTRRTGVSKRTGQNYDFIEIHYVAPTRGVIGEAALTTTIDPGLFPFDNLVPGLYNFEFDNRGSLVALAPVQQSVGK